MEWNLLLLFILVIGILLYYRRRNVIQEFNEESRKKLRSKDKMDELFKGYKLLIVPKVTTRLKILKLRDKVFKSEKEFQNINFRMDEATPWEAIKTWKELGLNELGKEIDAELYGAIGKVVWTDIGMMYPKDLESYYNFLENFRTIIENEELSPPERVERVQMMDDENSFLIRLHERYGIDFPENIFIDRLTKIDGISASIGKQFYDIEIYDIETLSRLNKSALKNINGIGSVRADKIKKALNENYE